MYLKRLEIHGFKSFAQKTTMEFDSGIIAIVGPNGSGKSNVADCLRWVLGEQSSKLIRGKSSQDVIFAGSEKKAKMGFAEVAATFDNADHRIPVDSAEVSIGRRIDRSGESEYLINGNRVRLLDIVDLVLKSSIGTSRYTVIGQGTIDQMVLAGPAEVKNLLDEASGVKNYYIKREKTLRRLEQTAQNLMRAEDLMAEIEPRLKSLRRQAKRMEARVEIEQELKVYQREFFGKHYWQLKQSVQGFAGQISGYEQQRDQLQTTVQDLRMQAEHQETAGVTHSEEYKKIQEEVKQLQNQKNKLLEDVSLVRGKMQSQKNVGTADPKTLQIQAHEISQKLEAVAGKIKTAREDQTQARQALAQQTALLHTASKKLEEMYKQTQTPQAIDWRLFELELQTLDQLVENFYQQINLGGDVSAIKPMAEKLRQQFLNFKTIVANASKNPEAAILKMQQEMHKLIAERDSAQAQLATVELDVSKLSIQLEFMEREHKDLEKEKLHVDLELKKAESHSQDEFLQSLMAEENKINAELQELSAKISRLENLFKQQQDAQAAQQRQLHGLEGEARQKQDELAKIKDQLSAVSVEKAKVDTQMAGLTEEILRSLGQDILNNIDEKLVDEQTPDLEVKINKLKNQLDTIGGMDELTLKEYQETEARYNNLHTQVEDLKHGMEDLRQIMDELDEHIKTRFSEAFGKISEKFEHYFRVLFNGGRAYLTVLKSDDEKTLEEISETAKETAELDSSDNSVDVLRPEEKVVKKYEQGASNIIGIDIKATPPGKKLASIQALSGGERALTSIALLCSLLTCFPSPFVVLDEVDAALDDANTIRFGQILGTLAHQTQFITITHNRETMAQAAILYGVTMGDDGVSKLLSVKIEQAKQFAK